MATSRSLRSVNLNLLPILRELLHHQNVSAAARSLNLSQAAVSASLKKLRILFGDDLLVLRGRGMVLTETATALLPRLDEHLDGLKAMVEGHQFDPESANLRFRINTADIVSFILLPHLLKRIAPYPGISIEVFAGDRSGPKDLKQGVGDLIIGPKQMTDWNGLDLDSENSEYSYAVCFEDRYVAIESSLQPPGPKDMEGYLARPHLSFSFRPEIPASIERDVLQSRRLTQNNRAFLPETMSLLYLVAETDAVALIPAYLAGRLASTLPLRVFEPPLSFPNIKLVVVWPKSRETESALRWFREQTMESWKDVTAASENI